MIHRLSWLTLHLSYYTIQSACSMAVNCCTPASWQCTVSQDKASCLQGRSTGYRLHQSNVHPDGHTDTQSNIRCQQLQPARRQLQRETVRILHSVGRGVGKWMRFVPTDPPEATQGGFEVGRGADGGLLVLTIVSLQGLIPPVQLLIPTFLHQTRAELNWKLPLDVLKQTQAFLHETQAGAWCKWLPEPLILAFLHQRQADGWCICVDRAEQGRAVTT